MKKTTLILLFILVFVACKRKETTWDIDNTAPLFRSELSLNDVTSSFLTKTSADSSYNLVYENLIFDSKLYDLKTPDTSITTSFNLQRLKLLDNNLENYVTLGQINPTFNLLNGQTLNIPAASQSNLPPQSIDASEFFETATFNKGFLDITITNELPVTLDKLDFELQNQSDMSVIARDVFINLGPNSSETKSISLAGKTVNKGLLGLINLIETAASSGPVQIDASKGIRLTISVREMEPQSAIAAFPNQNVVDQDEGLVLDMGGPEIKTFNVASGRLLIEVESTIQENMTMDFQIPSAELNGVPLKRIVKMAGAAPGSSNKKTEIVDMTGYLLDFRGKNPNVTDTVNTFHQILKVSLDSSGRKVKITLNDSIRISYRIEVLRPNFAVGYLGQTNNPSKGRSAFDIFKGVSGSANVGNFTTTLIARNTIGVQGQIKINQLSGENVFTKTSVPLTSTLFNNPQNINYPTFLSTSAAETTIALTQGNSNINNFIGNFPQWIDYDIDVTTNPNGNTSAWRDFLYADSRLQLYLRLESDANFNISGLELRDTQSVNFGNVEDYKRLKKAFFLFDLENQFPIRAELEMALLDAAGNVLTNIDVENGLNTIKGSPNLQFNTLGTQSKLIFGLGKDKMKYLANGKFIAIKIKLLSTGGTTKIYNWQKIKMGCNLRFEYEASI